MIITIQSQVFQGKLADFLSSRIKIIQRESMKKLLGEQIFVLKMYLSDFLKPSKGPQSVALTLHD